MITPSTEYTASPSPHSSTFPILVQLTCTEVRRKRICTSTSEPTSSPSLPDKSIVHYSGYTHLNDTNDVAIEITRRPNGTTAIARSNKPSNNYSLNGTRNIWLILRRFGLTYDDCSAIFGDIDTEITSSSSWKGIRGLVVECNIWKIITKVYRVDVLMIREYRPDPTLEEENNECVICMEDFKQGEILTNFPCDHHFHRDCILNWMMSSHKCVCPLCRFLFYRP